MSMLADTGLKAEACSTGVKRWISQTWVVGSLLSKLTSRLFLRSLIPKSLKSRSNAIVLLMRRLWKHWVPMCHSILLSGCMQTWEVSLQILITTDIDINLLCEGIDWSDPNMDHSWAGFDDDGNPISLVDWWEDNRQEWRNLKNWLSDWAQDQKSNYRTLIGVSLTLPGEF